MRHERGKICGSFAHLTEGGPQATKPGASVAKPLRRKRHGPAQAPQRSRQSIKDKARSYLSKALHKAGHFSSFRRELATRHSTAPFNHVLQYVRTFLSGHHLRRKPWAGDRLRRRRLSAAHRASRKRHPALSRSPPPRPIALHHPTPGTGRDQNSLRRVCG